MLSGGCWSVPKPEWRLPPHPPRCLPTFLISPCTGQRLHLPPWTDACSDSLMGQEPCRNHTVGVRMDAMAGDCAQPQHHQARCLPLCRRARVCTTSHWPTR